LEAFHHNVLVNKMSLWDELEIIQIGQQQVVVAMEWMNFKSSHSRA
jgi:hypothetical protein